MKSLKDADIQEHDQKRDIMDFDVLAECDVSLKLPHMIFTKRW